MLFLTNLTMINGDFAFLPEVFLVYMVGNIYYIMFLNFFSDQVIIKCLAFQSLYSQIHNNFQHF